MTDILNTAQSNYENALAALKMFDSVKQTDAAVNATKAETRPNVSACFKDQCPAKEYLKRITLAKCGRRDFN